ncbi:hypothetical protein ACWCQL_21245 [Streptomyces sp. NPDC002073]
MTIEMLGHTRSAAPGPAFASLYAEVQRFYEHQMRLFDAEEAQHIAGERHWIGMLDARPQPDGTVLTKCSALVYTAAPGGGPKGLHVRVLEDVLARCEETADWTLQHRTVTRDNRV